MTEFAVGQRWLSENETELGLGMVQSVDHRLVTIFYPANEEQRTYAKNNAPLSRKSFEVGDSIETLHGEQLIVESVEPLNDILVYMAKDEASGDIVPVPETQLSYHLQLNKASDRLFSGQIDSKRWFELRHAAMKAKERQQRSEVTGLQGARVDLIGHQLYIASEVGSRYAPRVLLADEVGLGKTIEAGLIIHQQLINHRAHRVLIVVPQPLVNQWFVEMIRRFNLHFSIFDQERIESLTSMEDLALGEDVDLDQLELENPYLSEQLVLCSSEFLAECDLNLITQGEWDLLVVDEAHHLEWHPENPGKDYLRVQAISENTPGLLLLSATPEQLGQDSHFARLRLLDPDRFHSLEAFKEEQNSYQPIAELANQVIEQESWDSDLKKSLKKYIDDIEIDESNREDIIGELIDRNGTGRVLYRNTRKHIKGFPKRKVIPHPVAPCDKYFDDVGENLEETINYLLHPETQYTDESWLQFDPRIEWLKDFLKQNRDKKILIICAHKDTAIALDLHCRFKLGVNCCTFHEDMDLISRDRAAAHFADSEDGAQAMFCSEIGSEGRNFQFSHQLVLMDLPVNPDLLEQRIGRLDRIGQKHDIEIHVPFMQKSAQEVIFNWYHQGMNAFEKTNAAGAAIYAKTKASLFEALLGYQKVETQKTLVENTQQITAEINKSMESGRDRLLEMASFDQTAADELVERVAERDSLAPRSFMESCWDRFGVNLEEHSEKSYVVTPGDHMFIGSFPALPEDGVTVTYDRQTALSRDDIQFLSWEHPMVSGAVEMVLSEDKGNACVCILKNKAIKAGTLLMEVLYHVECVAPKYLQAQRFLPFTSIRVLVDVNGNDLAAKVSHEGLSKQCKKLQKNSGRQVLKSEERTLKKMLEKAEIKAKAHSKEILDGVLGKMQHKQKEELNRLLSLQKKNPNIREEEIDFVKSQTELLTRYIGSTDLQLDAVRVIVAV
ncbi:RNA polymerase-associated protein RapA [Aliikangiella sp. G2MR2-5]|uniref:RNA polymerase-associated protein RapA n=1 Tax=Aliikangiella sp. G2MR2-5 TaxID=2788943 RepID=UPI0018AA4EF2|nr:RNA polymerase-associated protein RapA [Aliikangiella sp. G2MR2-5]